MEVVSYIRDLLIGTLILMSFINWNKIDYLKSEVDTLKSEKISGWGNETEVRKVYTLPTIIVTPKD